MTVLAASPSQLAAGQIALAAVLAAAGFYLLLPRPRGRSVVGGIAALLAAVAVFGAWVHRAFGGPVQNWVEPALFALFGGGAVVFAAVLVTQRNPARGAIAFAFVILSTCGLFLLLAAPFLMAATIIIYAGAIIVTFLFVLMLSAAGGPSDENDRTREPLLGSLAGFAFVGLVLFTLYQTRDSVARPADGETASARPPAPLPAPVLTPDERQQLADVAEDLRRFEARLGDPAEPRERLSETASEIQQKLEAVVGVHHAKRDATILEGSVAARLQVRARPAPADDTRFTGDAQAVAVLARVRHVRQKVHDAFDAVDRKVIFPKGGPSDREAGRQAVRELRDEVLLLRGEGELPARNVANLGLLLYADHLLAVELAGTLLLVATIGAVAIAHRRGGPR